jgi:hypothetical protein
MELKVIYLPALGLFEHGEDDYHYKQFDNKNLGNPDNYIKTRIGTGNELIMDKNKRKSFTFNKRLILGEPKRTFRLFQW